MITAVKSNLKQLLQNGSKVLVHSLLGFSNQRPPDVGHGVSDACIGVVLVTVQLRHQLGNVGPQLLPCQLGYARKPAQHCHAFSQGTNYITTVTIVVHGSHLSIAIVFNIVTIVIIVMIMLMTIIIVVDDVGLGMFAYHDLHAMHCRQCILCTAMTSGTCRGLLPTFSTWDNIRRSDIFESYHSVLTLVD